MTQENINNLKLEVLKVVVNRPNSTANMPTIIEHTKEILDKVFDINDSINVGKDITPSFFNPGFDSYPTIKEQGFPLYHSKMPSINSESFEINLDYSVLEENRKKVLGEE